VDYCPSRSVGTTTNNICQVKQYQASLKKQDQACSIGHTG